jgi:endonuclease G
MSDVRRLTMPISRTGYRSTFLSVPVPLPQPTDRREAIALDYVHFTVLLDPARRLAAATAVNIDGRDLKDLDRADYWHYDARVPKSNQAGPDIYARNDLDRGHLVRRRDPVWGDAATAAAANQDTFVFTNAAPQAAPFNQGPTLWVGLEDHVLRYAQANEQKLNVFTGPVLAEDDPEYRGLQVPRRFWKIASWITTDDPGREQLSAAGFVLDQSEPLDAILAREQSLVRPPPLGPYLTYQVPIDDIAELTGLDLAQLSRADVLEGVPAITTEGSRWMPLLEPGSIRL